MLVSIVTPCFEHQEYLVEYFESILAQDYQDIELIFIDDESRDESWAVVDGFRPRLNERFTNAVLLRNEKNLGLLQNMRRLLQHVSGDVVCILESDDVYYPTKISENVNFLEAYPAVGLVHSDFDSYDSTTSTLTKSFWATKGGRIPEDRVFDDLLWENFIMTCTMACRTSLMLEHARFDEYAKRGYRTADYPAFLDLAQHTSIGYLHQSLSRYRVVHGSISHPPSRVGLLEWKKDYYRIKLDFISDFGCPGRVKWRAENQFHSTTMRLGWLAGSASEFIGSYAWFSEYNGERLDRWTRLVRRPAVTNRGLWRLVRWFEGSLCATSSRRLRMIHGFDGE